MKKEIKNKNSPDRAFALYGQGNLTQQYLHKNMIINSDR